MKRFWVSWYEPVPEGDSRPRKWPLANGVKHYWVSGETGDGAERTLCAVIDAEDEESAEAAVSQQGWSPSRWRFCDERQPDWMPDPGRFPPDKGPSAV